MTYEITPSKEIKVNDNPSPSKDPFYDIPENVEQLNKAIAAAQAPDAKFYTWDELKKEFDL